MRPVPTDPRALRGAPGIVYPPDPATPTQETARKRNQMQPAILKLFTDLEGEVVHIDQIVADHPDWALASVRASIRALMAKVGETGSGTIHVVIQGQAWRYVAEHELVEAKADSRPAMQAHTFKLIGQTEEGPIVLQDDTGRLWKAMPL